MVTARPSLPATSPSQYDFSSVRARIKQAITDRAFPAANLAVTHRSTVIFNEAFGRFTYDPNATTVTSASIFDLASLTKVIATTTMAMILHERGKLDLDTAVVNVVPEFASDDARRGRMTLRMLLAHSSGLPAYARLFEHVQLRSDLLDRVFAMPLEAEPGTRAAYSDIGFILLGVALERLADQPMDEFCQREIFTPLGLSQTTFNPAAALKSSIVPTEDDKTFRHRVIQGGVHDENAWVLGGVAGHAGLFGTAHDVAQFALCMLRGGNPILKAGTIQLFRARASEPPRTSHALGWDTPSQPSQSGRHLSSGAYGHLGFTGTSLWIDPVRDVSITFLTNRVWPDRSSEKIKQVRPALHDAIVEAIDRA